MAESDTEKVPLILCIEDDEDIQRIVKLAFRHLVDMTVAVCGDPRLALDMAHSLAPDLILLDYLMPHLNGEAVFRGLRADARLAAIPVVFLTASVTGESAKMLRALGAEDVVFKPFNTQELVEKVSAIIKVLPQRDASQKISEGKGER